MERSLYPDGVVVEESDLSNTEQTRSFHIQRRQIDSAQHGRVQGLLVSISSPATRLEISAGRGYTPRGDLIEVPSTITNVALQDYTSSVENLVCLAYSETLDRLQTHETLGRQMPTRATASYQVVVLTRANYNALPDSSSTDLRTNIRDANLASFAKDRLLVLRVVTGNGYSGGTPNDLTPAQLGPQEVYQPDFVARLNGNADLSINGGEATSTGTTISGVSLKDISGSGLVAGTGTLTFTIASNGTRSFTWTFPSSGSSAGTSENVVGTDQLESITLNNNGATITLVLEVAPALLPQRPGGASTAYVYTQSVVVEPFYTTDAQRYSATDDAHRDLQGSYIPSKANPHGLGYQDLVGEVAVINKPVLLGNELRDSEAEALIPRISTPRALDGANADRTLLWEMGEGAKTIRLYKTSSDALEIVVNARYDGSNWVKDDATSGAVSSRWVFAHNSLTYQTATAATFADNAFVEVFSSGTALSSLLRLGEGFISNQVTSSSVARLSAPTHTGAPFTLLFAQSRSLSTLSSARIYLTNSSIIATVNASFSNALNWSKDAQDEGAFYLSLGQSTWELRYRAAATGGTWASWSADSNLFISGAATTGAITTGGKITSGGFEGAATLSATSPRFISGRAFGDAPSRVLISEHGAAPDTIRIRQYAGVLADPHYATEETAFNCSWNGSNWVVDSASYGSAYVIRKSRKGTSYLIKTTDLSIPWSDTAWNDVSSLDTTRLILPAGSSQPGPANTGIQGNALYAISMIKSWGIIRMRYTGSAMVADSVGGFNYTNPITGAPYHSSDAALKISFVQPMTNTDYMIMANTYRALGSTNTNADADLNSIVSNNAVDRYILPIRKSLTDFELAVALDHDFINVANNTQAADLIIQFIVLGNQAISNSI